MTNPDWADEVADRTTKEYWDGTCGDEITVSRAAFATALRKAKAEGHAAGLREAAEIMDKCCISYDEKLFADAAADIRTRADEVEKG